MRSIRRSWPIADSKTSTPPTAMLTGPCSAASEDRSAGERSSAICSRPYPPRMMRRVTSHRLVTLLVFAVLAAPAMASDATVNYQCCQYAPASVRIAPGEQVNFVGTAGADFTQHPLRFTDPALGQEDLGSSASRMFPTDGVYTWYCNVHGINGGAMKGAVAVTL